MIFKLPIVFLVVVMAVAAPVAVLRSTRKPRQSGGTLNLLLSLGLLGALVGFGANGTLPIFGAISLTAGALLIRSCRRTLGPYREVK